MTSPHLEYPDFFSNGDPVCTTTNPDMFFPESHVSDRSLEVRSAKAVCAECPYKAQCLEWALKYEDIGIWGGMTQRERIAMKRQLRRGRTI